jgi:hypothetical protein
MLWFQVWQSTTYPTRKVALKPCVKSRAGLPTDTAVSISLISGGAEMYILRIEHPVLDFDGWKKAFDSDPVGREKSGVRRYRVLRPIDDANYVMIDLEFDTASQAEALLAAMRVVWGRVEGTIMMNPQARIVEAVETKVY